MISLEDEYTAQCEETFNPCCIFFSNIVIWCIQVVTELPQSKEMKWEYLQEVIFTHYLW